MRWSSAVLVITLISTNGPAAPSDSEAPGASALERDPRGWTDVLATAGASLEGWTRGPIPPAPKGKLDAHSPWSLDGQTGYLVCDGKGGHEWLRWNQELGDFIFHVEWRFTPVPGKKGYNSGVYARNSADGTIWHQAQTGDASGGFLFGQTPIKGKLEPINLSRAQPTSRVKAAGDWNTFELTCRGSEMTLWVNGAVTNQWAGCEVARGFIGVESEGYRIEFRQVKIKPLVP